MIVGVIYGAASTLTTGRLEVRSFLATCCGTVCIGVFPVLVSSSSESSMRRAVSLLDPGAETLLIVAPATGFKLGVPDLRVIHFVEAGEGKKSRREVN